MTLRLDIHPAARPTNYLGHMRASFIEDAIDEKLGEINAKVDPEGRPIGPTVIAQVTSRPGSYALNIFVDAIQPGDAAPQLIAQNVPVVVQ